MYAWKSRYLNYLGYFRLFIFEKNTSKASEITRNKKWLKTVFEKIAFAKVRTYN